MANLAKRASYMTPARATSSDNSSKLRMWAGSLCNVFSGKNGGSSRQSSGSPGEPQDQYHQGSFAEDVVSMASHLKKVHRATVFVVSPDTEERQLWDVVVALAIVFTAIVVPLEVSAMSDEDFGSPTSWLFWVNRCLDLLFLSDICVNCITAYLRTEEGGDSAWERRYQYIILHYARTWLLIDVVSTVPYDLFTAGTELERIQALRVVRMLKLLRVVRAARVFARWQTKNSIPYAKQSIGVFIVLFGFICHFFACMWLLVGL